jgi:copper chaperone
MSNLIKLNVVGMTCDHCARAVSTEIGSIPGVDKVHVDLPTGQVRITADRTLSTSELREAVEEAGYTLA